MMKFYSAQDCVAHWHFSAEPTLQTFLF